VITLKKIITEKLGIDGPIFYTLLGKGVQIFTSLGTILFITIYLTGDEQGYYYTYGSILGLQIFFQLGLTQVITQFVSHEYSYLKIDSSYKIVGTEYNKSRLSSLLHFCVKWYSIFAILLFLILLVVGHSFFCKYSIEGNAISWEFPWVLLVIGTSLNLLMSPIISFISGFNKVKEIAQIQFIIECTRPIIIWGGLFCGLKLYVSGIFSILIFIIYFICIFIFSFHKLLYNLWKEKIGNSISYLKEIFPFQWRVALSSISGYLMFQLFNPILFATEGAKIAGQMGMTLTALYAIIGLSGSWINTKVPKLSMFIELKKYDILDTIFKRTLKQIIFIESFAMSLFVLIVYFLQKFNFMPFGLNIGNRFLPIVPILFMSLAMFARAPVDAWSTYLRCHKKEPLMFFSIITVTITVITIIIVGNFLGLIGITISFSFIQIISILWAYKIYKKKKREWHITVKEKIH